MLFVTHYSEPFAKRKSRTTSFQITIEITIF